MKQLLSSVSRKGQVTIPLEIRHRLGIKPRDKIAFSLQDGTVTIAPVRSSIRNFYQSVPALDPPRTLWEMAEIAAEEHAQQVAREGRD